MENIHQQKKKRVKRKKRKISDAKRSAMAKKKQSVRKKKKQTRSVHKAFRKASTGITINLNLAQPQQPLRKRLKSTRRRVHRREALVQPIVNASQFRNQNTFYKPSVNNTGNSLIEYARGGAVMNVSNGLNFGASGAMAQLQIDKEGSKRINTETGRNVGEEERQIRRIMQQKGNLATLLVVKKWLKSEGYSINSSMKKDDVIEYVMKDKNGNKHSLFYYLYPTPFRSKWLELVNKNLGNPGHSIYQSLNNLTFEDLNKITRDLKECCTWLNKQGYGPKLPVYNKFNNTRLNELHEIFEQWGIVRDNKKDPHGIIESKWFSLNENIHQCEDVLSARNLNTYLNMGGLIDIHH